MPGYTATLFTLFGLEVRATAASFSSPKANGSPASSPWPIWSVDSRFVAR